MARGGNARAFKEPMTLEQTFPGLQHAPGGAIIAVADNFFDFLGQDTNGKTDPGHALLFEIEDVIQAARRRRVVEKLPDEEGEVTGD